MITMDEYYTEIKEVWEQFTSAVEQCLAEEHPKRLPELDRDTMKSIERRVLGDKDLVEQDRVEVLEFIRYKFGDADTIEVSLELYRKGTKPRERMEYVKTIHKYLGDGNGNAKN